MTKRKPPEERRRDGQPTKYRAVYCKEIVELSDQGLNMYDIAAKWRVCIDSLHEWQVKHVEFSEAYRVARTIQAAKLMQGLKNGDVNPKAGALLMAHTVRMSERRRLNLPGLGKGTLSQRGKAILNGAAAGNVDVDEAQKLMTSIAVLAQVDEKTEQALKIEALEKEVGIKKN